MLYHIAPDLIVHVAANLRMPFTPLQGMIIKSIAIQSTQEAIHHHLKQMKVVGDPRDTDLVRFHSALIDKLIAVYVFEIDGE